MLADLGFYLLHGLVLLVAWAAGSFLLGGVLRSERWTAVGRRASYLSFATAFTCSAILIRTIFDGDYGVAYVTQVTERALPPLYKFTAFWAGMDGSMLMWLLFLLGFLAMVLRTRPARDRELVPWIGFSISCVALFFAVLVAFQTNPLARLAVAPADGQGMNPALQNYWMAIHPPTLYLGYVGLTVPFAFAFAALVTGRLGNEWVASMRRWILIPWLALGIGMLFGGHWAYVELGWGGYWAWDPVENASFMPWLAATAYLHSVMIQERRGMFRAWNVFLVLTAFILSIFGTFLTRSGIVESVHSFARSGIGPLFLGFVVVLVAVSTSLMVYRWPQLRSAHRMDSLVSREFSFMLNNLGFMTLCAVTLCLTMYPAISETLTGERWTVGAPAYNEVNGSIGILLLTLTGIGPLIAWRRASGRSLLASFRVPLVVAIAAAISLYVAGARQLLPLAAWTAAAFTITCILSEFAAGARVVAAHRQTNLVAGLAGLFSRNRRRYGGYIVHLAIAMFFIGVAGMAYRSDAEAVMSPGDTLSVHGLNVRYDKPMHESTGRSEVDSVVLEVSRGGKVVASLSPEFKVHHKFPEPEKDVSVHQTLAGDLYAILAEPIEASTGRAKIQVLWNPMVAWVWYAGYLLLAGTLICLWPDRKAVAVARREERAA